jgi:hypothetical protein
MIPVQEYRRVAFAFALIIFSAVLLLVAAVLSGCGQGVDSEKPGCTLVGVVNGQKQYACPKDDRVCIVILDESGTPVDQECPQ